jgi:ribonuclease HI
VQTPRRRIPRRHRSPIHTLILHFSINSQTVERIKPYSQHPGWQPTFSTHISESKEEAASYIRTRIDDTKIFSDGSGYKGKIGAAAVTLSTQDSLQYHLGSIRRHTVFEAELVGILLALQLAAKYRNTKTLLIALDNQAAIRALTNNRPQPGQHILSAILTSIRTLQNKRRSLRIHLAWVPGHANILGNELADDLAKKAAEGQRSPTLSLPTMLQRRLPASTAALKAHRKTTVVKRWSKIWAVSPRYPRMRKIDTSLPSWRTYKMLASLSRRATSIIVQLRTGHVGLNIFLRKISAVDSALCPRCRAPESVAHFLLHCKRFDKERNGLKRSIGKAACSLPRLLNMPKNIPHTIKYIESSNRFKDYKNMGISR